MSRSVSTALLILTSLSFFSLIAAEKTQPSPKAGKALSEPERNEFLKRRTSGRLAGKFSFLANMFYTVSDVNIEAPKDVLDALIEVPFVAGYKPTWHELFDALGRATQTTWTYRPERNSWVFGKPAPALPYSFKLANNWTQEDQGGFLMCKPSTAPVGMDIYCMGSYSFEKDAEKSFDGIRDKIALTFASRFSKDIQTKDMKKIIIDGVESLYFETPTNRAGVIWRQWVLVKNGIALAVVSAVDAKNEKAVLPDVEAMLKTLSVRR